MWSSPSSRCRFVQACIGLIVSLQLGSAIKNITEKSETPFHLPAYPSNKQKTAHLQERKVDHLYLHTVLVKSVIPGAAAVHDSNMQQVFV